MLDNELVSGMYFYVTGGFAQWSGIVKKILLNLR